MKAIRVGPGVEKWVEDERDCSEQCWRRDPDRFNKGLVERQARGW